MAMAHSLDSARGEKSRYHLFMLHFWVYMVRFGVYMVRFGVYIVMYDP